MIKLDCYKLYIQYLKLIDEIYKSKTNEFSSRMTYSINKE